MYLRKGLSRRDALLRRLEVDLDLLAASPQITPLLKQNGIKPERVVEVLRCDDQPESLTFVQQWDAIIPASRSIVGIEAIAIVAGITPRRLWELFQGASLVQAKQSVSVLLAESLPKIMQTAIRGAKMPKGQADREHVLKAARILPVPKGSTTVINMPGHSEEEQEELDDEVGRLESADEFMLKASRAMNPKALPVAPSEVVEAEEVE